MARNIWKEDMAGRIYELRRQGKSQAKVAADLGVSDNTMRAWKRTKPEVSNALDEGLAAFEAEEAAATEGQLPAPTGVEFSKYLYKQLPDHLQELWDEVSQPEQGPSGIARAEALLADNGEKARQYIFMHAFAMGNFDTSRAMRTARISKAQLDRWILADPDFVELLDEIQFHKKNFLEHQLLKLVKGGDTTATVYANKTLNADRGFGDKMELEVSGTIRHEHTVVLVDQLGLPLSARRQLLSAVRAAKATADNIVDITPR